MGESVVTRAQLWPLFAEANGASVMQAIILDHALVQRAKAAGIELTPAMIEAERTNLLLSLHSDPNLALPLLKELRVRRGLGEQRFRMLLRHNALLRALVGPSISIGSDDIERQFALTHGPKRQARIITISSMSTARSLRQQVIDGSSFAELAARHSTDISASRGGLLEIISGHDPAYPLSLRRALETLQSPGDVSDVVLIDEGYALLQLVGIQPGTRIDRSLVADDMAWQARLSKERVQMERLATQLLNETQVEIFDNTLDDAWRQFRSNG